MSAPLRLCSTVMLAVAPVATQGKVPMIVMNAVTTGITAKSPYMLRTSMITFVSLFGLDFGVLVGGGALLTEVVFGLPGVGLLTYRSLVALDLPVRQDRHRGYHDSDPAYRDKESRRTYDRFLQRFRGREDLRLSSPR